MVPIHSRLLAFLLKRIWLHIITFTIQVWKDFVTFVGGILLKYLLQSIRSCLIVFIFSIKAQCILLQHCLSVRQSVCPAVCHIKVKSPSNGTVFSKHWIKYEQTSVKISLKSLHENSGFGQGLRAGGTFAQKIVLFQ